MKTIFKEKMNLEKVVSDLKGNMEIINEAGEHDDEDTETTDQIMKKKLKDKTKGINDMKESLKKLASKLAEAQTLIRLINKLSSARDWPKNDVEVGQRSG